MVEKSGAEVLALLADEVPDGPRRCDLITLQEFAQCLSKALTTESKELTEPLAGIFLIKALAGVLEYTNTPSGRLSVYVINEYYNRRLGDKERVPTDEDLEDYQAACRAGHYMEKPRVKVSERTETINHLIKSYKSHFSDVKKGDANPNQYPGDVLAVVREDAFKAFGLASFLEQPLPDTEPAVIQSEPAAAPEQPAEPVGKIGKRWTEAEKNEMRQQRADGWNDGRIAEHWNFKRQNVARLIGSQSANKATANTPKRWARSRLKCNTATKSTG